MYNPESILKYFENFNIFQLIMTPLISTIVTTILYWLYSKYTDGTFLVRSLKEYFAIIITMIFTIPIYILFFIIMLDVRSSLPDFISFFLIAYVVILSLMIILFWLPIFKRLINHFILFKHTDDTIYYESQKNIKNITKDLVEITHLEQNKSNSKQYKSYSRLYYINPNKTLELIHFERSSPFLFLFKFWRFRILLIIILSSWIYLGIVLHNQFYPSIHNYYIIPLFLFITFYVQLKVLNKLYKDNNSDKSSIKENLDNSHANTHDESNKPLVDIIEYKSDKSFLSLLTLSTLFVSAVLFIINRLDKSSIDNDLTNN